MSSIFEPTIFELMAADKPGFSVNDSDPGLDSIPLHFAEREDLGELGQACEVEVVRHYTRLSTRNFDIDRGMYPLGSCTMKHNPRVNEVVASDPDFENPHPEWPERFLKAHHQVMAEVAEDLKELSGFDHLCLQPAAGAQGELTATLMIRAYHDDRNNEAKSVILIPDSAHGTNPASAAMAGFRCRQVKSGPEGYLRLADLEPHLKDDVAGLMLTNPNTLGIYERDIVEIAAALKAKDAILYVDGANLNAIMGVVRPGRIGADVMHFNVHKTLSTPHGGGGPGSGPIGFNDRLAPFAPGSGDPRSIGPMKAWFGQWGMFVRAWAYIRSLGGSGLREASEEAVLNARYLRHHLQDVLNLPYGTETLHESVFNDKLFPKGIGTLDFAKRLIDFGFHPPTVFFPIHVKGAIMIEPTETESLAELDRFIAAVKTVVAEAHEDPEVLHSAPHSAPVSRVDEVHAARFPDLRWHPKSDD